MGKEKRSAINKRLFTQKDRDIQKLVNESYLQLGDTSLLDIQNPLLQPSKFDNPFLDILDFMGSPDYFSFTCKHLFNIDLLPFQCVILKELWVRKFPMLIGSRGMGKTFVLGIYALLRAIFHQGCKIILVGGAFRQSKLIFEVMEDVWRKSPILRRMTGTDKMEGPKKDTDRWTFYIGHSQTIAIPIGTGEKIRGLRANYLLSDEFSSIPEETFEVVIKGFAAVAASPSIRVQQVSKANELRNLGLYQEAAMIESDLGFGNQTVLAGTAHYSFDHFYKYWKRYKEIIESKGDEKKLITIFGGQVPEAFDWKDYSIFRIPYHILPKGFMDDTQVAQSKATFHKMHFDMEYNACFADDSGGFIGRKLIESCVTKVPVQLSSGLVQFQSIIQGNPNCRYIYGIDPASEQDNFAIIILEIHPDHRRIVYCWTANRQSLKQKIQSKGKEALRSFYNHCARKIRELMKIFPTEHIAMDAQGGGIHIMEAMHDLDQMEEGDIPVWQYIKQGDNDVFWWEDKDKLTDGESGQHIIHLCEFAKAQLTYDANHGIRKDLEDKVLLFPQFDPVEIELAIQQDKILGREFNTLEDCVMEIEELKDEMSTIIHSQTPQGRDKWDTPEVKLPGAKKGRLRKDRYSALLLANLVARVMEHQLEGPQHEFIGGFVGQKKKDVSGRMYSGPEHIVEKMQGGHYGRAVFR